jgi:hypothetical protein
MQVTDLEEEVASNIYARLVAAKMLDGGCTVEIAVGFAEQALNMANVYLQAKKRRERAQ